MRLQRALLEWKGGNDGTTGGGGPFATTAEQRKVRCSIRKRSHEAHGRRGVWLRNARSFFM